MLPLKAFYMHLSNPEPILHLPIASLTLSDAFKGMAAENGFSNLDEILSFPLSSLFRLAGFTPSIKQEFMVFLEQEQLVSYLKQY